MFCVAARMQHHNQQQETELTASATSNKKPQEAQSLLSAPADNP